MKLFLTLNGINRCLLVFYLFNLSRYVMPVLNTMSRQILCDKNPYHLLKCKTYRFKYKKKLGSLIAI